MIINMYLYVYNIMVKSVLKRDVAVFKYECVNLRHCHTNSPHQIYTTLRFAHIIILDIVRIL